MNELLQYTVDAFVPPSRGCATENPGWDPKRCEEFAEFLNGYAQRGFRLHTCEYREVTLKRGCGPSTGTWLVCIFERNRRLTKVADDE